MSTGTFTGNFRETETLRVRARHTPRPSPSPSPSPIPPPPASLGAPQMASQSVSSIFLFSTAFRDLANSKCQETETGMVRACHTHHDSLTKNHPSGHLRRGMPWRRSTEEMLDGRHHKGGVPANAETCSQGPPAEKTKLISAEPSCRLLRRWLWRDGTE